MRGKAKQQKYVPRHTPGIVGQVMQKLIELRASEESEATQLEVICQEVISKAMKGDLSAANMVFDRIEGKPGQAGLPPGALGAMDNMSLEEMSELSGVPIHELRRRQAAYLLAMADGQDADEEEETADYEREHQGDDYARTGLPAVSSTAQAAEDNIRDSWAGTTGPDRPARGGDADRGDDGDHVQSS